MKKKLPMGIDGGNVSVGGRRVRLFLVDGDDGDEHLEIDLLAFWKLEAFVERVEAAADRLEEAAERIEEAATNAHHAARRIRGET